jgi:hypothetical protein
MAWNEKYWDIHDQLYWSPRYLGLKSISKKKCVESDALISVPRELVNPGGPLYTRVCKAGELREYLHTQEEILNQIFNITFAIAPDALVREALVEAMGFNDQGSFESLGREVATRYGWGESENVVQHDGLFVSETTALGVELKLLSPSSPDQIAKYAALLTWEELHSGRKSQLGLLFVMPEQALRKPWWKKCRLEGPTIDEGFFEVARTLKLPKKVATLFTEEPEAVRSVLDRMVLAGISWRELHGSLCAIQDRLDPMQAGEQTLHRLIAGFRAQLEAHRHTEVGPAP